MDETFFQDVPEYVAAQLTEALGIPILPYVPSDMREVLDNLPSGWVDWQGEAEWEWERDQSASVALYLAVVVLVAGGDQAAAQRQRELVGRVLAWAREDRNLGGLVRRALVLRARLDDPFDWAEMGRELGVELHGIVTRAGGVLLLLLTYDR